MVLPQVGHETTFTRPLAFIPTADKISSPARTSSTGSAVSETRIVSPIPDSSSDIPTVIISNTVKGKGVSFMEKQIKWHCGSLTKDDLQTALSDLEAAYEKQRKEL